MVALGKKQGLGRVVNGVRVGAGGLSQLVALSMRGTSWHELEYNKIDTQSQCFPFNLTLSLAYTILISNKFKHVCLVW